MLKYIIPIKFIILILIALPLYSADVSSDVAIFSIAGTSPQLNAAMLETEKRLYSTFASLGRFIPIEDSTLRRAITQPVTDTESAKAFANRHDLKACVIINIYSWGPTMIVGEMKFIPATSEYNFLAKTVTVRSRILGNIPLKLAKELALMHENLPVIAEITGENAGNLIVKAGQWHGIKEGKYKSGKNKITVLSTSRYESAIKTTMQLDTNVVFNVYPNITKHINYLDERIEQNIINQFGASATVMKGVNPEKRFIEGLCVINPGANICLPGFGAYLATGYQGFTNISPDLASVALSTSIIFTQFTLTEFMSGFNTNFFPWIQDKDKSSKLQNLQIFMWSTIPLTVTAAYFDQLAKIYLTHDVLPPFYTYRDETAFALSLLFPGTGLMYKGHRIYGWLYFLTEMSLASHAIYTWGEGNNYKYSVIALGAVKLLELSHAYLAQPNYRVSNFENEQTIILPEISFHNISDTKRETIYAIRASIRF